MYDFFFCRFINDYIPMPGIEINSNPVFGCSCEPRCCAGAKKCCPHSSDAVFAYTSAKRVRLPPGKIWKFLNFMNNNTIIVSNNSSCLMFFIMWQICYLIGYLIKLLKSDQNQSVNLSRWPVTKLDIRIGVFCDCIMSCTLFLHVWITATILDWSCMSGSAGKSKSPRHHLLIMFAPLFT